MIVADRVQCRQVLINLIANAIQAINGKGKICVEIRQEEGYDLIAVQDDGPGVDVEHRHRLFEPLFSTKALGTGLGLSICREIIERHGGTIDLQQSDSTGSMFCVKLPRKMPQENR